MKKFKKMLLATFLAGFLGLAATACGGGGGSGATPTVDPQPSAIQHTADSELESAIYADPRFGSVLQTGDSITGDLTAQRTGTGNGFDVRVGGTQIVDENTDIFSTDTDTPGVFAASYVSDDAFAIIADANLNMPDYLIFGVWGNYQETNGEFAFSNVAVFVDGAENTTPPTSGSATYIGAAGGLWNGDIRFAENFTPNNGFFSADANFDINFRQQGAEVSGRIENIRLTDTAQTFSEVPINDYYIELSQRQLELGVPSGGTPDTSGCAGGCGKWGGQFFGGDNSQGQPKIYAGTFGIDDFNDFEANRTFSIDMLGYFLTVNTQQ